MAQSSTCYNLCQNPHDGKDKLAGGNPTESSDCCMPVPAAIRAFTPTVAFVISPLAASSSVNSSMVRYFKDDLQRILKTVLDSRLSVPVPAPVVAAAAHYEGPRKRLLKAWFPGIY